MLSEQRIATDIYELSRLRRNFFDRINRINPPASPESRRAGRAGLKWTKVPKLLMIHGLRLKSPASLPNRPLKLQIFGHSHLRL
jgi:hypothetical protein